MHKKRNYLTLALQRVDVMNIQAVHGDAAELERRLLSPFWRKWLLAVQLW